MPKHNKTLFDAFVNAGKIPVPYHITILLVQKYNIISNKQEETYIAIKNAIISKCQYIAMFALFDITCAHAILIRLRTQQTYRIKVNTYLFLWHVFININNCNMFAYLLI